MRYNLACSLTTYLDDSEGAMDLLEPYFGFVGISDLEHAKIDPDMDRLRGYERFKEMVAAAAARIGAGTEQSAVAG
jgi:hypothetical protein